MACHATLDRGLRQGVSLIVAMRNEPVRIGASARHRRAVAVMPSTSKSPKTRMRFLPSMAARRQSTTSDMPGIAAGSTQSRSTRGPGTTVRHPVSTPRETRTRERKGRDCMPGRSCAASSSTGATIQSEYVRDDRSYTDCRITLKTRSFPPMRLLDGTRDLVRIPETGRDRRPASMNPRP